MNILKRLAKALDALKDQSTDSRVQDVPSDGSDESKAPVVRDYTDAASRIFDAVDSARLAYTDSSELACLALIGVRSPEGGIAPAWAGDRCIRELRRRLEADLEYSPEISLEIVDSVPEDAGGVKTVVAGELYIRFSAKNPARLRVCHVEGTGSVDNPDLLLDPEVSKVVSIGRGRQADGYPRITILDDEPDSALAGINATVSRSQAVFEFADNAWMLRHRPGASTIRYSKGLFDEDIPVATGGTLILQPGMSLKLGSGPMVFKIREAE